MRFAFFGSSLLSSSGGSSATYFRGLLRELHARGHRSTFYEPGSAGRSAHRDLEAPRWARVVVYSTESTAGLWRALEDARRADVIVKASAVGAFDSLLESAILDARSPGSATVFWDVHPSATLAWLRRMPGDPLLECLPRYDLVITTGGGNDAVRAYLVLGARRCAEICGAVDPSTHRPLLGQMRFASDLTFLGNRRSRQLARVRELFLGAAALLRRMRFLLAGAGWNQEVVPANVKVLEPVSALEESALYCSARAVLDVSGEAKYARNVAPSSRLFEAAGSGACIIADAWDGIERFFEPGREILVAASPDQVADHMRGLSVGRARAIGRAALTRALSEHTFERRVNHLERLLDIDSGSALAAYTA